MQFQTIVKRPILRSWIEHVFEAGTGLRFRYATNLPKITDRHLHLEAFAACGAQPSGADGFILDVGGHTGESALAFHRSFPLATIHSFEPISFIFEVLRRNCLPHSTIHCHRVAVGDTIGELRIALSGADVRDTMNSLNSVATSSTPPELVHVVKIMRLDDFCLSQGILKVAVLKIDVEGFECRVLEGARTMLREGRISHIIAEFTLDPDNKQNTQLAELEQQLREFNYSLTGFYESSYDAGTGKLLYSNALFKLSPQ
jgi:FkbM family methyltransferase